MTTRSRQIKEIIGEDECLPENTSYCRKCMKVKGKINFLKTTTPDLDSTNCLSVCTSCVNEMYGKILLSENGNIQKTVLKLCRMLNVRYEESAIESALKHIESSHSNPEKLFGLYRAKLLVILRTNVNDTNVDLTYQDNPIINFNNSVPSPLDVEYDVVEYWGKGYEKDDYGWLEKSLFDWKKTHKCDTKAEETLLKEIVFKQFEIEKARREQKSTANLVKELQDLMKTASVDPAKSNKASEGRNYETFSSFIKMIEEDEPAEVFGDEREPFKDFQGIGKYFERYVTRPLSNFVKMSRDFNIESLDEDQDDDLDFDLSEEFLPEEVEQEETKDNVEE